jgi:hypothetical protein
VVWFNSNLCSVCGGNCLQAMAWHVTGDDRYASKVLQIVDAHAGTNKEWGLRWENGPLVSAVQVLHFG